MSDKPKVFDISKDEQEHWELEKKKHDEPAQKVVEALDYAIQIVLKSLGVKIDTETPDEEIHQQLRNLGIFVQEYNNQPNVAPQLQGIYIHQCYFESDLDTVKEIKSIAFIPDPGVDVNGKIQVKIVWLDSGTLEVAKTLKLTQNGRISIQKE